jgi:hypothetical protein
MMKAVRGTNGCPGSHMVLIANQMASTPPVSVPDMSWLGTLVPVLSAHPYAGASGVALALADAAASRGLRVGLIDCSDPARSGLAGVCQVEGRSMPVGRHEVHVRAATRNLARGVIDVRRMVGTGGPVSPSVVPAPAEWLMTWTNPVDVTVVDLGWDLWSLMAPGTALGPLLWCRPVGIHLPVLVVRATVPSVALAEGVVSRYMRGMSSLGLAPLETLAVVGASSWPKDVLAAMGHLMRAGMGRAVFVPSDEHANVAGWTISPSPATSIPAAEAVLRACGGRIAEAMGDAHPQRKRKFFR